MKQQDLTSITLDVISQEVRRAVQEDRDRVIALIEEFTDGDFYDWEVLIEDIKLGRTTLTKED